MNEKANEAFKAVIEQFGEVSLVAPKGKRTATTAKSQAPKPKLPKLTATEGSGLDREEEILEAIKSGKVGSDHYSKGESAMILLFYTSRNPN